ncbi:MAG TPA: hypothetical protein VH878_09745 [Thermodesulfobacteriota bacterium]|jgi:hypothetical protein
MAIRDALTIFILVLLFLLSTLVSSPSFSCQTSIKRVEGRVVCLLPGEAKGRFKPVMALVTEDGEFYPIVGSENLISESTHYYKQN